MSKSPTIIDDDGLLYNPHAGDILASEFMEPLALTADSLALELQVAPAVITGVIDGTCRMNGDLDLRLGRYFGMSDGFFLRLQNSHDLAEARRAQGDAIERITRRAA